MTTIDFRDLEGNEHMLTEVFKASKEQMTDEVNANDKSAKFTPYEPGETLVLHDSKLPSWATEKEDELVKRLKDKGCTILSCKTELISKRRYKRRLAKANKKLLQIRK